MTDAETMIRIRRQQIASAPKSFHRSGWMFASTPRGVQLSAEPGTTVKVLSWEEWESLVALMAVGRETAE